MTENYNLRTQYEKKLQFTHFVWKKAMIYTLCMRENYYWRIFMT
jgi:hypothetical protein